jgi:zinc and cadmium transporter
MEISLALVHALLAAFVVSLMAFVGLFYKLVPAEKLKRLLPWVLALAIGVLLGNAFFHLIPEAVLEVHQVGGVMVWVMGGILFFMVLEKSCIWYQLETHGKAAIKPIGYLNLVGDGIHNFIDGMVIAGSFMIGPELGLATTMAILLHELPQELGDAGTLIFSGYQPAKVVKINFLVGLSSLLGVGVVFLMREVVAIKPVYLLALTAGGFIYMAIGNLLPALLQEGKQHPKILIYQFLVLLIAVMMIFGLQNGGHHHEEAHSHDSAMPMGRGYSGLKLLPSK